MPSGRKTPDRLLWENKFLVKIEGIHKRNKSKVVQRILRRAETTKYSLVSRSKKLEVECNITTEELRQLIFEAYGQQCKYCHKILKINNLVVDHITPISKGGVSNKENLQVICKTSNCMKGSLYESDFQILLAWLDTVSEELRRDITIRLARGIH